MNDQVQVNRPVIKAASVAVAWWGGVTWGEMASMLAAIYTMLLITDWLWKRVGKPFALRRGWVRGKPRAFMDTTKDADL